jgi:hypothetical protein
MNKRPSSLCDVIYTHSNEDIVVSTCSSSISLYSAWCQSPCTPLIRAIETFECDTMPTTLQQSTGCAGTDQLLPREQVLGAAGSLPQVLTPQPSHPDQQLPRPLTLVDLLGSRSSRRPNTHHVTRGPDVLGDVQAAMEREHEANVHAATSPSTQQGHGSPHDTKRQRCV